MSLSDAILATIRNTDYIVSLHHMRDYIELHSIKLPDADDVQIVRADTHDADGLHAAGRKV